MNTIKKILNIILGLFFIFLAFALSIPFFLFQNYKESAINATNYFLGGQAVFYVILSIFSLCTAILFFKKSPKRFFLSAALLVGLFAETLIYRLMYSKFYNVSEVDIINLLVLSTALIIIYFLYKNDNCMIAGISKHSKHKKL